MSSSLVSGLIPIAGAGKGDRGGDGGKKADLTGGLISIGASASSRPGGDDLDFGDFDVDDLLLDDASKGGKSSKPKSSGRSESPRKKQSSTSKKKDSTKKKSKKSSSLEDSVSELDAEDTTVSSKKKSAFDDDDAFLGPPVKKTNRLDDEFARMLGLEDELSRRPSSPIMSSPVTSPPSLSPPPSSPPSPGKTKTLIVGTPSKVREVEFELSKDELLEEILSSPAASPSAAARDAKMPNNEGTTERLHTVTTERDALSVTSQLAQRDAETLREQLDTLQREHARVVLDLHTAEAQRERAARDHASLMTQHERLEAQLKGLQQALVDEKSAHQTTQLELAQQKRDLELRETLDAQRERQQMQRLHVQLQSSLAQLEMLRAQLGDDEQVQREVESASRLRMISSLEATSRAYAQQTESDCQRLSSLLGTLEATLRHARQAHLEEKERLAQEQRRLDVLSAHFQAQTNVLHEQSDAHAQRLAASLQGSLQDVRVADARLSARRTKLEQDEAALFEERARFAAHRESWLEEQSRRRLELQEREDQLAAEWRTLRAEQEAFERELESHDEAFQALNCQRMEVERERDQVAAAASHVAEMALRLDELLRHAVAQEQAAKVERAAIENERRDPSGLTPEFRRLIEENWAKLQSDVDPTDAALRKERLWLHSLGLQSPQAPQPPLQSLSQPRPQPQPQSKPRPSTQLPTPLTRGSPQRLPPPPPRAPLVRVQL
ncbi:hypothetical protein ATCC90586_008408 [Pythium insidiosum]|nr:hypothetical protein ATCC90586_008408 [Pythium insidiosum]